MAMRDIGSHAPDLKAMGSPKAFGSRRFGRTGEPAAGESVRASGSLDDPSSAAAALPLRASPVNFECGGAISNASNVKFAMHFILDL